MQLGEDCSSDIIENLNVSFRSSKSTKNFQQGNDNQNCFRLIQRATDQSEGILGVESTSTR